ncbi:fumarate hydratase class II [Haloferula luteola]|uniref:Fumarate hydratase class II n=1 Tax=Haloferula luteola TaxID=595692 RepID=A0A840V1G8_9BACT|nr:class II fumarate hydratase [Haloferula luteola]MBB5351835.1 fumarate hydratase class II [Haloferula luteola]
MKERIERDSLGDVAVREDRIWGAQTQRSLENFPIGDQRMPLEVIGALAEIKHAAATVNEELSGLDPKVAEAIRQAATEVVAGRWDDHFPLKVFQTGSGTQTNMNVNEVLAYRARELHPDGAMVHPNDDVNRCQSSNDSFPTAMHVAAVKATKRHLLPELEALAQALLEKARAFAEVVKIGRTHCQDATPLTVGQEFGGYQRQVEAGVGRVMQAMEGLYFLAQGGTAVGTGLNAPVGFAERMAEELARRSGEPFRTAPDKFEALAAHDAVVFFSGALKTVAGSLFKIANDLRLLASGPRSGFGELRLPANEPGSSIMPGKVNPTQCEALTQVCLRVMGNDATITMAGSQGQFELNTYKPLMIACLLESIRLLGDGVASFRVRCVEGIELNRDRIDDLVERSLMLVTALSPEIGYDRAAAIAKAAHAHGTTLREEALAAGISEDVFDRRVRPERMVGPMEL